jgi:hypothetical protein
LDIEVNEIAFAPSRRLSKSAQVQLAISGQWHPPQLNATFGHELMPRHDVGVVFHVGQHHHITGAQMGATPPVGDQIHGLGRVAGEDDFFGTWRIDEAGDLGSRALISVGGFTG